MPYRTSWSSTILKEPSFRGSFRSRLPGPPRVPPRGWGGVGQDYPAGLRALLILGTNWPASSELLGCLCAAVSWGKKQGRGVLVQVEEAEQGPLRSEPWEQGEIGRLILSEHDDFPLEQSQDESLKHAFEQVHYIDGQPLQPAHPLSSPYFAIIKDRLYRVTQDAQTKEDTTQLLVPKSRHEMLFQAAHCNPMAGHLGPTTTLNRLMTRFVLARHSREYAQVVRVLS